MKKIIVITYILISISQILRAQDLKYDNVQSLIHKSIIKSFPERFNASDNLKDMFYQRCDQYPNYCRKLKFKKILDIRIHEVLSVKDWEEQGNAYEIVFSFDFLYHKDKNDFMGSATMTAKLDKVLDQYQITHLKFNKTSGRNSNFKHQDRSSLVLFGKL
ncbi:hypothetical protein U6A24_02620 [Aquimarina gracilis]|uniref:Uncharacterized protein n=1 Tax=Aquimarina gracilis TaxID=874422 RepID=A0ABU5ZQK1_9FLAO|nr:hypothetical protein [Aquimarina gracilis]MEB3344334.1 hypothetical protein [Aquimarina gracilis]